MLKSVYRNGNGVKKIRAMTVYKFHNVQIPRKLLEQRLLNLNTQFLQARCENHIIWGKGPASCPGRYRKCKQNFIPAHR